MTDRYATLRDGLVGAWCPSIAGSGFVVPDLSNVKSHAVASAPTYGPIQGGNAYRPRGGATFDYLVAPYRRQFDVQAHTVSLWFSPTTTQPQYASLLSKPASTANSWGSPFTHYALSLDSNNAPYCFLRSTLVSWGTNLTNGLLYHMAYTWNGSTLLAYQNGVQVKSQAVSGSISYTSPTSICIGYQSEYYLADSARRLDGFLDDVRVYSRVLTPSEIGLLSSRRGIGLVPTRHRRANVLGSQFWLRDAGTWKKATGWIKVNGVWTKATPKLNVGGTWN